MARTFKHFPEDLECIVCGTSKDGECVLIPKDNTSDGNVCEAVPVHVSCLEGMRYSEEGSLIYKVVGTVH